MKSLFTLMALALALLTQAQNLKKDTAILNKGTVESKYADARIAFNYSGKIDKLLNAIAEAHGTTFTLLRESEEEMEYRAVQITKPTWVYGNYNVHVVFKKVDKGMVQVGIWHTYFNKSQNITGSTLSQLESDVLEFYQAAIDASLKK